MSPQNHEPTPSLQELAVELAKLRERVEDLEVLATLRMPSGVTVTNRLSRGTKLKWISV